MEDSVRVARARALEHTTNTPGWSVVLATAQLVLRDRELAALECQDDDKIIGLQRKAQAAREFMRDFTNAIESAKNPQVGSDADQFITVTTE